MSGRLEFDPIEKDFKYSKDLMGPIKEKGKVDVEEFKNTKTDQVKNIREILGQIDENEIVAFTDGSALWNPGPAGVDAEVYLKATIVFPILLKNGVSPVSNNYTEELVGILIALKFMVSLDEQIQLKDRNIHFITDCQPDMIAAFNNSIISGIVDIVLQI